MTVAQPRSTKYLRMIVVAVLLLLLVTSMVASFGYGFTYQPSNSMPKGLYVLLPVRQPLHVGEVVLFDPPDRAKKFLQVHHWLPSSTQLMKPVLARYGDMVCIRHGQVYINHKMEAPVLKEYAVGHLLPTLSFCRVLAQNEYWLMSTHITRSFDSRYFGPVSFALITAKAKKI